MRTACLLCAHANEIMQRDFALKTIWIDDNYFNARSMDVYITKLRKHLKEDDSIEIINIHGKGYKLITPEEEEKEQLAEEIKKAVCMYDANCLLYFFSFDISRQFSC